MTTSQVVLASSTDSQEVVTATVEGADTVTVVPDATEISEDGNTRLDATEDENSSRAHYLRALEAAEKQAAEDLAALEPLDEESRQTQAAMLEQEGEAEGELTPEELGAIRRQAVQDAIAAGRAQVMANNPQLLAQQYAQAQQQGITEYQTKLEQAKTRHSDWDAVFQAVAKNDVEFSPAKTEAIQTIGGPELAYRLAKNLPEARRIAAMPDHLAVATIGQMAAKLNAPQPQATRPRQTLRPVKPVSGTVRPAKTLNDPDISYREWRAIRDAQAKDRYRK